MRRPSAGQDWRRAMRRNALPVKAWPRIGLAPRRDVGVTDDSSHGIMRSQRLDQGNQPKVLGVLKGQIVAALELDADGKIIAARSAVPARHASVPGAPPAAHELQQSPVATDQKMS